MLRSLPVAVKILEMSQVGYSVQREGDKITPVTKSTNNDLDKESIRFNRHDESGYEHVRATLPLIWMRLSTGPYNVGLKCLASTP